MPHINLPKPKKRDFSFRTKEAQGIYQDKRWKRVRAWKFRENPLCEDCLLEGRTTVTQEVHHIIGIDERPDLAFDPDNLVSLCIEHHVKRHRG